MNCKFPFVRPWTARTELVVLLLIGIIPAEFNWLYNPRLADSPRLFWSIDVARFVVLPTLLVGWGLSRRLFTFGDIGLHTRVFGRSNRMLFFPALILVPLLMHWEDPKFVAWARSAYPTTGRELHFDYAQVLPPRGPETGGWRLLAVTYMALSAAATEELIYRGILRRLFPPVWLWSVPFVVFSAALFASIHWYGGPAKLLYTGCVGLLTAIIYALTGNLWPLIVGHFVIDFGWLSAAP